MSTALKSAKNSKDYNKKLDGPVPEITALERAVTRRVCKARAESEEEAAMFISMLLDEPKYEEK